jgi:hypothetical protein
MLRRTMILFFKHNSFFKTLIFFCIFSTKLNGHGFGPATLIKAPDNGWWSIEQVCRSSYQNKRHRFASYNTDTHSWTEQRVKSAGESEANCYFSIRFDNDRYNNIICTPTQEFYISSTMEWKPTYTLKIGDALLCQYNKLTYITHIEFVKKPIKVYSLEVRKTHTFFVGTHSILTHNMIFPLTFSAGLTAAFGSGAVIGGATGSFLGPITFIGGIAAGGLIGLAIKILADDQVPHYRLTFNVNTIDSFIENNNKQNDKNGDAQAPGKPTEEDGYIPPKNWDGKKVKHPKNGKVGWPDSNGNIWVPTGPGSKAHGGPHWDVQYPNGKEYDNVYPGGKIRKK